MREYTHFPAKTAAGRANRPRGLSRPASGKPVGRTAPLRKIHFAPGAAARTGPSPLPDTLLHGEAAFSR